MNVNTMGGTAAIQELSFDEMDLVGGAGKDEVVQVLDAVAGGAALTAAGATFAGAAPVAAGAAVVGLVAFAAARIID